MIPKPLLFASTNEGKFQELSDVALEYGVRLLKASELAAAWVPAWGEKPPSGEPPEVEEGHVSYESNARLKAEAYFKWSGFPSLGDDTGLEVDALGGEPGVGTARYAGIHATPEQNMKKLLGELEHAHNRKARFRCVLHLVWGTNLSFSGEGVLEGEIGFGAEGTAGFGYDPIFVVEGLDESLAQIKSRPGKIDTHRRLAAQEVFHRLRSSPLVQTDDYSS